MYPIRSQHWITGIVLAAVLHVSIGWALFRETPDPGAMPSTGLSVEIFSSGLESLAASSEFENIEMVAESDLVETVTETDTEVLEAVEMEPVVEPDMAEEVPPEPVQEITQKVSEMETIEPETESVPVETAIQPPAEQVVIEKADPQPIQELTVQTELPEYTELPVIEPMATSEPQASSEMVQNLTTRTEPRELVEITSTEELEVASTEQVKPAEAKVESAPTEVVQAVEKPVDNLPHRESPDGRVAKTEKPEKPEPNTEQESRSAQESASRASDVSPDAGTANSTSRSSAATPAVIEQSGINTENIRDNYFASISAVLAQAKRYPKRAVRRKLEGTVKVNLVIDRNGELVSFDITQTSRHRVLDREVERMIQRSAPYPEIPTEIAGNTLSITVPVEFFLR